MTDPRRDHWFPPTIGADSDHVLDVAIASLAKLRGLAWHGDAGTTLHLLASLIDQAQARLPRAVDDTRDQGCSWAEIADLLGVTRASAWQRYAGHDPRQPHPS
jgi:hypothetical protein